MEPVWCRSTARCTTSERGSTIFVPSDAVHAVGNTGNDVLRLLYVFGVDSFDDVEYVFPT